MTTNRENVKERMDDHLPAAKIDWSKPGAPVVPQSGTAGAAVEQPTTALTGDQLHKHYVAARGGVDEGLVAVANAAIAAYLASQSQATHQPSEKDIPADAPRAFAKRYSELLEKNRALEARNAELEVAQSQATMQADSEEVHLRRDNGTPSGVVIVKQRPVAAPVAKEATDPEAPAILEAISWHARERDDLTLEEAVEAFRNGYKKVRQREDRAMLLQLIRLMASAPASVAKEAPAVPSAWMRANRKECTTAESKAWMENAGFGHWPEIANEYTIPLYEGAAPQAPATQEADQPKYTIAESHAHGATMYELGFQNGIASVATGATQEAEIGSVQAAPIAAAVRAAERVDAMHKGVVGAFAAIKAEHLAQANVLPPTRGTESQRDAGVTVLSEVEIVDLAIKHGMSNNDYENDPAGYCYSFARAIEAEVASRFRAQGGNTKAESSYIAPTTSTVSAPIVQALAKRLESMGVTNFSFTPGPNATPETVAAEISKALDQLATPSSTEGTQEAPEEVRESAVSEVTYNPNHLLDVLLNKMQLKNDAALARMLEVAPVIIAKIRRNRQSVGVSLLIRMHEVTGISVRDLRDLMGDRRTKYRLNEPVWTEAYRSKRNPGGAA